MSIVQFNFMQLIPGTNMSFTFFLKVNKEFESLTDSGRVFHNFGVPIDVSSIFLPGVLVLPIVALDALGQKVAQDGLDMTEPYHT